MSPGIQEEFAVPLYYVVKHDLTPEEQESVERLLLLTPCYAAFVADSTDLTFARGLCEEVVAAIGIDPETLAEGWARTLERPMLTFGNVELIDAVYDDGTRIALECSSSQIKMN
jgi:hypothetical protein